MLFVNQITPQT